MGKGKEFFRLIRISNCFNKWGATVSRKGFLLLIPLLFIAVADLKALDPVRIMPVGNSITAGEHYGWPPIPERTGYRKDLYWMLIDAGYNVDFVGLKEHGQRPETDPDWYDWNSESYPGWQTPDIARMALTAFDECQPDILLVHTGTNGFFLGQKAGEVMDMLDDINQYSVDHDHPITVFLCKIVKRFIEEDSEPTSQFNADVADSVAARTGDKIEIIMVDMENGAGLDYTDAPPDSTANPPYEGGDYWGRTYPRVPYDMYHPNDKGNTKMAVKFYEELIKVLEPPQTLDNNTVAEVEIASRADSTLKITWAANFLDEEGYIVERSESGGAFTEIGRAAANTRFFMDSIADAEKEYKYRVRAYNTATESLNSEEVTYMPAYYTVTTEADGQGTISLSPRPANGLYLHAGSGATITFTAEPAQGWKFKKWSGDIVSYAYSNPNKVTIASDFHAIAQFSALTAVDEDDSHSPKEFVLHQNYPNPFNPSTSIRFELPVKSFVTVKVFNVNGKEVATLFEGFKKAGSHHVTFDASHLSSGVYFYRVKTDQSAGMKRLLLMK